MEEKGSYKNLQDHVLEKKKMGEWNNWGQTKIFKTMFLEKKRKKWENGTIGGIQRETGQSGGWLLRLVPGRDCN